MTWQSQYKFRLHKEHSETHKYGHREQHWEISFWQSEVRDLLSHCALPRKTSVWKHRQENRRTRKFPQQCLMVASKLH